MNPDYNFSGIKCRMVAEELIDHCLTEEQQEILKYTQGKMDITAVDELNMHYADKYLTYKTDITKKYMAITVYQYGYLLDQIKGFKDKLLELTKPESYYKMKFSDTAMQNLNLSSSSTRTENESSTIGKSVSSDESAGENVSAMFRRGAGAATHAIQKHVEEWDVNRQLDYQTGMNITKKTAQINLETKEVGFTEDVMKEKEVAAVKNDERIIPYNDFNYDFNKGGGLTTGYSSSQGGTSEKYTGSNTDDSKGWGASNSTGNVKYTDFRRSDAVVRSFVIKIVNLRVEFFNKFLYLFQGYPPYQCRYVR